MTDQKPATTYQLRQRRSSANRNLPLNLEVGYQINEGGPAQGTPSPSCHKSMSNEKDHGHTSALLEFRKKQQSFDVTEIQIEECEEEEIFVDSDDEGEDGNEARGTSEIHRAVTPTPIQDFAANTVYTEGPQNTDFLKVGTMEHDGYTDVSDADTSDEE